MKKGLIIGIIIGLLIGGLITYYFTNVSKLDMINFWGVKNATPKNSERGFK